MVPRRAAVRRFNLGDRVDRGNLAFLAEPSPRPTAVAGSASRRRPAPGRNLASNIRGGAGPIRQEAYPAVRRGVVDPGEWSRLTRTPAPRGMQARSPPAMGGTTGRIAGVILLHS